MRIPPGPPRHQLVRVLPERERVRVPLSEGCQCVLPVNLPPDIQQQHRHIPRGIDTQRPVPLAGEDSRTTAETAVRGYPEGFPVNPWFSCGGPIPEGGPRLARSQATEHEMYRADANHGLARVGPPLIVFAVTPVPPMPSVSTFHDPALGQYGESSGAWLACFDVELPAGTVVSKPTAKVVVVILAVSPNLLQPWIVLDTEPLGHLRCGHSVVDGCGCHQHRQQKAHGVHENMAFSPVNLLAAIVATLAASLGRLHRLTVDAGSAGSRIPARFGACLSTQVIHHLLPGAVVPPTGEVIVDGALGQKIVRQHVPLATRPVEVQDRVDDLAHVDAACAPAMLGWRNQRFQDRPLFVREVRRIRLPWLGRHGCSPAPRENTYYAASQPFGARPPSG